MNMFKREKPGETVTTESVDTFEEIKPRKKRTIKPKIVIPPPVVESQLSLTKLRSQLIEVITKTSNLLQEVKTLETEMNTFDSSLTSFKSNVSELTKINETLKNII
jgi:vacuolar-type H+-ATPase subunit I/STV1